MPCIALRPAAAAAALVLAVASAAAPPPPDVVRAARLAAEATRRMKADDGALWGRPIAAPFFFVRGDRAYTTTDPEVPDFRPVEGGRGLPEGVALWSGPLPPGVTPANTSLEWAGRGWAMLLLPLTPGDTAAIHELIHESFHVWQGTVLRLQPFNEAAPGATLLEEPAGRTWLRLEWLALADALRSPTATDAQVARALLFRARRYASASADERDRERLLDLKEGLAEYTGWKLAGGGPADLLRALAAASRKPTYVRSFAYATGPAYAALLDQRVQHWRHDVTETQDLQRLLARTLDPLTSAWTEAALEGSAALEAVDPRAQKEAAPLGLETIRREEDARWAQRQKLAAALRARFVDGPTLRLRPGRFEISFDPGGNVPLGAAGTVMKKVVWRTKEGADLSAPTGALVATDWKEIRLPLDPGRAAFPAAGTLTARRKIRGRGWSLTLPAGWTLAQEGASWVATPPATPAAPP
jgi:hypothetical protein